MTLVEHMQMNSCPRHPHESWTVGLHSALCWQCVHIISGAHIHSVKIYSISMIIQSLKIMLLCSFHWHSSYSIWISTFVLLHCVWFTGSFYGQQLLSVVKCYDNWLISTFISSTTHIHAYFCIFLLVLWHVTSTSAMALFGSVNLGHGTDACLHYTLNDIMPQMTQVFIFTFVVQWRLILLWKCWAFCEFSRTLMSFCDIYWTLWNHVMHVGFSWMTIELQWGIVQ